MPSFIAQVMLQDVQKEEIYKELDKAMLNEDGYSYITGREEKMYALLPDTYEFDLEDTTAAELLKVVKLICAQIEKKHNLKPTPIVVYEITDAQFSNLEELSDSDFEQ
jgi:hypothetical protein